jgi:hypothetical protein
LRIGLLGLELLLGELVLELLLLHDRRLTDLFELLLELCNPQSRRHCIFLQVDLTLSMLS